MALCRAMGRFDEGVSCVYFLSKTIRDESKNREYTQITHFYFFRGTEEDFEKAADSDKDEPMFVLVLPDYDPRWPVETTFWCGDSEYTMEGTRYSVRVDSLKYPARWASA